MKKFIEEAHGTDLWNSLQPQIIEIETMKQELKGAAAFKSDVEQLHKFKGMFIKNYNNMMLMNKYFTFGPGNHQVNTVFVWGDSFSGAQFKSARPIFDAISSKFNVGVCMARIACYMKLDGDEIKKACKYMQEAAWIFEDLKKDVSQLQPGETSSDFTSETLDCLSNMMLAQA